LDEADFIPDSYTFEVSSPGLGRPLKKEKDYVRNMGKQVEIRTYRSINHSKDFCGALKAYDAGSVTIEADDGEKLVFEKADIALIRQAIDF
jgi:ribosome maturation factor RimP